MPPLKPDRDKNFGGFLVFDFGQWWRHVKTIYKMIGLLFNMYSYEVMEEFSNNYWRCVKKLSLTILY